MVHNCNKFSERYLSLLSDVHIHTHKHSTFFKTSNCGIGLLTACTQNNNLAATLKFTCGTAIVLIRIIQIVELKIVQCSYVDFKGYYC